MHPSAGVNHANAGVIAISATPTARLTEAQRQEGAALSTGLPHVDLIMWSSQVRRGTQGEPLNTWVEITRLSAPQVPAECGEHRRRLAGIPSESQVAYAGVHRERHAPAARVHRDRALHEPAASGMTSDLTVAAAVDAPCDSLVIRRGRHSGEPDIDQDTGAPGRSVDHRTVRWRRCFIRPTCLAVTIRPAGRSPTTNIT
jgi:hypothetical protein